MKHFTDLPVSERKEIFSRAPFRAVEEYLDTTFELEGYLFKITKTLGKQNNEHSIGYEYLGFSPDCRYLALDVGEATGWAVGSHEFGTLETKHRKTLDIFEEVVFCVTQIIKHRNIKCIIFEDYTFGGGFHNYLQVEITGAIKDFALKQGCKLYKVNYSTCKKFCLEKYRVEPRPRFLRNVEDFKTQHELDAWLVLQVFLNSENKEAYLA